MKLPLYHQLLDLAYRLASSVQKGRVRVDHTDGTLYSTSDSEVEDAYLQQAVAIIDTNMLIPLSRTAIHLVVRIISEMKMNNVFWLSGDADANLRRTIAELKRNDILIATAQRGLYIINPFKLRRGKPLSTIMASIEYFSKENSIVALQDLRPPKQALLVQKPLTIG